MTASFEAEPHEDRNFISYMLGGGGAKLALFQSVTFVFRLKELLHLAW